MPGEAAKKQKPTEWGNQQEERRRDERRQTEREPQQERRREERRQERGSANTTMRAEEQSEYGQQSSTKRWQGENAQSGTSQAQKGDPQTPAQQTIPAGGDQGRRERSSQEFGESYDPAFGEGKRGAGGKIDSTQRDMGQTGQTMSGPTKLGGQPPTGQQQGPYGPREKHRGPVASGKPLLDDWGKSDKH